MQNLENYNGRMSTDIEKMIERIFNGFFGYLLLIKITK